jgi:hypothetical protein
MLSSSCTVEVIVSHMDRGHAYHLPALALGVVSGEGGPLLYVMISDVSLYV